MVYVIVITWARGICLIYMPKPGMGSLQVCQKLGLNFYKLSHDRMFSRPKILFLVSLLFVALLNPKFNPYLPFKFLIFYHSSIYRDW